MLCTLSTSSRQSLARCQTSEMMDLGQFGGGGPQARCHYWFPATSTPSSTVLKMGMGSTRSLSEQEQLLEFISESC